MTPTLWVFTIALPAVLLLGYGAAKLQRTVMQEAVWTGFLGGVAASAAVWFWQLVLVRLLPLDVFTPIASAAGRAFLIAALPEEGVKLCLLLLLARTVVRFGDSRETILTSLGVSIGFAAMKDAALLLYPLTTSGPNDVTLTTGLAALLRIASAMPLHGITGLAMGALVALACRSVRMSLPLLVPALLVPVAMHAGYDFVLTLCQHDLALFWTIRTLPLVMATSVLLSIVLCNLTIRRGSQFQYAEPLRRTGRAGALGLFMVIISLTPLAMLPTRSIASTGWELWLFCVVPLILGIDLVLTARRRSGPS